MKWLKLLKIYISLFFVSPLPSALNMQVKLWLSKLLPNTDGVSESRIYHPINSIIEAALEKADAKVWLREGYDFNELPGVLSSLGLNRLNIDEPDGYSLASQTDISNEVVIELSKLMSKESKLPIFLRKWVVRLSVACQQLTESKLKTLINKTLSRYKHLLKLKKSVDLEEFLKSPFYSDQIEKKPDQNKEITMCNQCIEKKQCN